MNNDWLAFVALLFVAVVGFAGFVGWLWVKGFLWGVV